MVAMAVVIVMVARGAATGGVMTVVEDGRITAEMIGGSTTMITETVDGLILTVDAETIVLIATETGTEEIVTAVEGGARAGHVIDVIVAQMIGTDEVEIGIGTVTAAGAVDTAPEVGRDRARQARMVENANTVETTDMDQAKDNLAGVHPLRLLVLLLQRPLLKAVFLSMVHLLVALFHLLRLQGHSRPLVRESFLNPTYSLQMLITQHLSPPRLCMDQLPLRHPVYMELPLFPSWCLALPTHMVPRQQRVSLALSLHTTARFLHLFLLLSPPLPPPYQV
mmetsp:Transcript_13530/g.29978  ORF Transcript_13530/g.29978 Transcript_13530/m.29978 type:complete len:280 (+) Transcript_13530:720-1559(+)